MQPQNQLLLQDLYLNINQRFETIHLKRSDKGEEGFEAFAQKSIQPFVDQAITPDYWLFHYQFTVEQLQRLPELSAVRSREFFTSLLPSLVREHITPRITLPMARAIGLCYNQKPLLTPVYEFAVTPLSALFHQHNDLNLVLAPFNAYTGVKTSQGVMLFSPTKKGGELLEGYMQHIADNFYTPQMPEESLEVGLVPAFETQLRQYADLCPRFNNASQSDFLIPQEAVAPDKMLNGTVQCLKFELGATPENLEALVLPHSKSGLHCSQLNYDIMCLQRVAKSNTILPPKADSTIYRFSYLDRLLQHEAQLRKYAIDGSPKTITGAIQRMAIDLLRRDFSQIRGVAQQESYQELLLLPELNAEQSRKGRSV